MNTNVQVQRALHVSRFDYRISVPINSSATMFYPFFLNSRYQVSDIFHKIYNIFRNSYYSIYNSYNHLEITMNIDSLYIPLNNHENNLTNYFTFYFKSRTTYEDLI